MANYPYERPGTQLDEFRDSFIKLMEGVEADFKDLSTALKSVTGLLWLEPVATFGDLAATYPAAVKNSAVMTRDTGEVYRYDGTSWGLIQLIDAGPVNEVDSRLSGILAQKADEAAVRLKANKIELEDASDAFIEALTGGATLNVLSEPQAGSVTMEKLDPLVKGEVLSSFPATNEFVNSELSGTSGWTASTGGALATLAGTLIITGDGSSTYLQARQNLQKLAVTRYHKVMVRVRGEQCLRIRPIINTTSVTTTEYLIENPVPDQWYELEDIKVWTTSTNQEIFAVRAEYADTASQSGQVLEIRYPVALNLTQIFGAGKEVTEPATIKELLKKFTNSVFSGTRNLMTTKESYEILKTEIESKSSLDEFLATENETWGTV